MALPAFQACRGIRTGGIAFSRAGGAACRLYRLGFRKLLDVTSDAADVVVRDDALPRRHSGPRTPGLHDSQEVVLAPLERQKIGGGRRAPRIGAVALRALCEVRGPGAPQLQARRRVLGGPLGERHTVASEDVGDLGRLK